MKILVVYNPQAAHRRAEKILPEVEAFFSEIGIDTEFRITTHKGNGTEIVRDADFTQYDGIVAAGGDGTLFEFVNGYFRNTSQKRIPLGNSTDWHRQRRLSRSQSRCCGLEGSGSCDRSE